MQHMPPQQEPGRNLEMSLREHLLAAGASGSGPAPYPSSSAAAPPQTTENPYQASESASPHEQYDQQGGQSQQYGMSGDSPGGDDGLSSDARKARKRELSTSKRAAQNRAAQRAFRQRKEGYIQKLEEQVKENQTLEQNVKALQSENYQLREYILRLQSQLLENQSDFPPAPAHVSLASSAPAERSSSSNQPATAAEHQTRRELEAKLRPQSQHEGLSQLQAAAAQAGGAALPHDSPYGLGNKHSRADDAGDVKMSS